MIADGLTSPPRKHITWVTTLLITIIFLNTMLFTWETAIPLIKSDGWRFIQIYLIPWHEGNLEWRALWSDHHPQPVTAILFILNAKLFSLRMDYEAIFSLMFSIPLIIIYNAELKKLYTNTLAHPQQQATLLITASIILSLTSTAVYTWSLVTLGFISTLFSIYAITWINRPNKVNSLKNCTLGLVIIILTLLVFGTITKLFLYAAALTLLTIIILERDRAWAIDLIIIATSLVITNIVTELIFTSHQYQNEYVLNKLLNNLNYIFTYILYVGTGLASALLNIKLVTNNFGASEGQILTLGASVLTFYLYSLYLFFRHKIYYSSILPAVFIITALLAAIGGATLRFDPTTQSPLVANVPRYYHAYAIGLVGAVWIHFYMSAQNNGVRKKVFIILILTITIMQILSSTHAWNSSKFVQKAIVNSYDIMIENANDNMTRKPPRFMTGKNHPEPYLQSLKFLKNENLNMFSKEDLVARHR